MRRGVAPLALLLMLSACSVFQPGSGAPDYDGNRARVAQEASLRNAEAATVRIRNAGCGALSTGSGLIIGERTLLTNAHVVAGAETLEINLWDGTTVAADVRGAASGLDLAKVEVGADLVNTNQGRIAHFAAEDPAVGDEVYVFGFPEGGKFTVLAGEVLEYARIDRRRSLVMSNEVVEGNSGGPVLDVDGRVVGVVQAKIAESGEGIAIPVTAVKEALAAAADKPLGPAPGCESFPPPR